MSRANNEVFEIEVLGWDNKNSIKSIGSKTYMVVSSRFFDEYRIATLKTLERLLYIVILAMCADERSCKISPTRRQILTAMAMNRFQIEEALESLERNELVKISKKTTSRDTGATRVSLKTNRDVTRVSREYNEDVTEYNSVERNQIVRPTKTSAPKLQRETKTRAIQKANPHAGELTLATSKPNVLISKYAEAWKIKHGSSPPITGKDAGIAKRLSVALSEEKMGLYLSAFFSMPDAYVIKARHPLELFEMKLKEIAAFAESGAFTTRKQAALADDLAGNMLLLEKIRTGEA